MSSPSVTSKAPPLLQTKPTQSESGRTLPVRESRAAGRGTPGGGFGAGGRTRRAPSRRCRSARRPGRRGCSRFRAWRNGVGEEEERELRIGPGRSPKLCGHTFPLRGRNGDDGAGHHHRLPGGRRGRHRPARPRPPGCGCGRPGPRGEGRAGRAGGGARGPGVGGGRAGAEQRDVLPHQGRHPPRLQGPSPSRHVALPPAPPARPPPPRARRDWPVAWMERAEAQGPRGG